MKQVYDLPLDKLREYKPELTRQPDFDNFWAQSSAELAQVRLTCERDAFPYPVRGLRVYRIHYAGFGGAPIEGWLAYPERNEPLPGIVQFHGYNWASDNQLTDVVNLALKGYAVFQMLCRGQQSGSVDYVVPSHGHVAGWMTKGIQDPREYYYRAVYMDAVRAVDVLRSLPEVDASRVAVLGSSQGGALALATAALSDVPVLALADYPYLSNFDRAIDVTPQGPYGELHEYFRRYSAQPEIEERARRTLTYFDVMNLAPRIRCTTWMCVGLVDDITPPSTVFAVYNHLTCAKDIGVYRYFGHEFIPAAVIPKLQLLLEHLQS